MMYPFMTLNDDTEITHSEMKIDGTVKVYIETPNDTGGFHHATCWLPEYKWQDIKGYSNLEIAYFKNYIASVSHIIMELSRTGGFNALYEKASPDLESLKNYQIDNPKYPTRIAQTELSKEHSYTTQDIDALPEGKRAELINGQIYNMVSPNYIHQHLVMELSGTIHEYIRNNHNDSQVLPAPLAVRLNADDKTYVEPDISVLCDSKKISERGIEGAPDFIIEIVSPATQKRYYGIKLFKYRNAGVREYWIVNPSKEIVNVFCFENEEENNNLYSFEEDIPVGIYPDFSINIHELLK